MVNDRTVITVTLLHHCEYRCHRRPPEVRSQKLNINKANCYPNSLGYSDVALCLGGYPVRIKASGLVF